MSKIFKAQQCSRLESFSFDEIQGRPRPSPPPEQKEEPAQDAADPLREMEQMIQQRLLEAERKAQELEQEGYQKGYAQGHQDGIEFGRKTMQITQEHFERLLEELQKLHGQAFRDYRQWFLHTCLGIAKRVVQRELTTRPELLMECIAALLDEAEASHSLTLYLNPKDLELLQQHTELSSRFEDATSSLGLKPDAQLERGGCRLESDIQLLDASMEAQFALLEENLAHETAHPANASS